MITRTDPVILVNVISSMYMSRFIYLSLQRYFFYGVGEFTFL